MKIKKYSKVHQSLSYYVRIRRLPEFQGNGYGSELICFTMEKAAALGCGALVITGSPEYYARFGFVSGHLNHIFYAAVPRNDAAPFFMVKELIPGFLSGVSGTFQYPAGYQVDDAEVDVFDAGFPPKEKLKLPGQLA